MLPQSIWYLFAHRECFRLNYYGQKRLRSGKREAYLARALAEIFYHDGYLEAINFKHL